MSMTSDQMIKFVKDDNFREYSQNYINNINKNILLYKNKATRLSDIIKETEGEYTSESLTEDVAVELQKSLTNLISEISLAETWYDVYLRDSLYLQLDKSIDSIQEVLSKSEFDIISKYLNFRKISVINVEKLLSIQNDIKKRVETLTWYRRGLIEHEINYQKS